MKTCKREDCTANLFHHSDKMFVLFCVVMFDLLVLYMAGD